MNMQDLHRMLQPIEHWNRKILAVLWVVFGFAVCIGIVHLVVVGEAWKHILVGSVLLPIGLLLVVIGVSEWLVRSSPVPKDWIFLVAADFIAVCLLICNPELPITASVFFLPILISVFYFVPKKVMYMTVAACLTLLAVYGVDPPLRAHLDVADLITFIAVLLVGGFICVQFMQRSVEMVAQLQLSIEANQDLMVQKIMMESVSKRDGLTDAYNHKSFHQHLENVLRQSDAQGTPVHLLIFDIDNFKRI
ncbi:GGDEF domain-containing protein [Alicyclobacillus contaminans]|uniref:GGDEF domain-containing protein n=1 Tax=Alicyclobacillus contaminans TaxID=392016 RepID=UPI00041B4C97|nr:diguanylate cyclase [Alicyclobacillus contaminans]